MCHESFPAGPARTCELGATCGRCGGDRARPVRAPLFEAVGEAVADDRGGLVVRGPGEPVHVYRRRADAIYRERRLTS